MAVPARPSEPTRPSVTRQAWLAVLLAAALALAACGGPREQAVDDTPGAEPDEDVDDNGDDGEPDDEAPDNEVPDDEAPDDEGDPGAFGEHRPPDDLGAAADCEKIVQGEPGAMIAFPSDFEPGWLDAGPAPVTVEVVGCSNTFEANLEYETFHGDATEPTHSGFTMGGTLGQWVLYSFEETFEAPGEWTVVVFELDAESGERLDYDEVTFTVD